MDLVEYFALPFMLRLEENGRYGHEYGYSPQYVAPWVGGAYIGHNSYLTSDTPDITPGHPLLVQCGFRTRQDVICCLSRLGVFTPSLS